ncbi:MAG: diacylglycerol kinase family protein [Novosphingobium sp.]
MSEQTLLWLVANSASGSNDEAAQQELVERLASAGHNPARIIDVSKDDLPSKADLDRAGVTTLAIFTGDGTIGAALPPLEGWRGQVLVLPGGTTNLLAKMLHRPCEVEAIVASFAGGGARIERRPCVRWSGHTALCEVLAGPGAKWSDVREGMREGDLGTVAATTIEAVKESTQGSMVHVTYPDTEHDDGYAGVRLVPSDAGLETSGYRTEGFGDLLKQGAALLKRDFREGPHDELGAHPEIECKSEDGSAIELMIDGERVSGPGAIRFSLATLELDLLATGNG